MFYLHWCFLQRSTQRSAPLQGRPLQAALGQPATRPRLSRTPTMSPSWPSNGSG